MMCASGAGFSMSSACFYVIVFVALPPSAAWFRKFVASVVPLPLILSGWRLLHGKLVCLHLFVLERQCLAMILHGCGV